jgi:hypothetical protein
VLLSAAVALGSWARFFPGASVLLGELNDLRDAPKMLWGVSVRSLVMPVQLDLRIESLRNGFAGQLTLHETR